MREEVHLEGKRIIVDKRYAQGKINCSACGKFVKGNVYVDTKDGAEFVCNVQCGINYIVGRDKKNE